MDRRDFLKTIGAASLIPVMPVYADTPDLKAWFQKNFNCHYGQPGPYVVDDTTDEPYRYKTFAVGVTDSTEYEAEKRLSQYFIDKFTPISKGCPKLYWRVEPQFAEIPVIEWGETWMTAEEAEDGMRDGKFLKNVGRKVGLSGFEVSDLQEVQKPENVEFDFDTGSYKYVLEKHIVHRMRFRLAIPSRNEQLLAFAKAEGELMENI